MTMELHMLSRDDRAVAADLWAELEARVPTRRLVSSWAWIDTWLDHFGDVVPHRFAIASNGAGLEGVVLLTEDTLRRGPLRVRRLHVGTAGEPAGDAVYPCYNALLAPPDQTAPVAQALARRLAGDLRWDALHLDRFAPEDAAPLLAAFGAAESRREQAPIVDLRAAERHGGDVLATLRPRTRQQIRRALRALGDARVEIAGDANAAGEMLDELIELHQRRWRGQGEPGVFASARVSGFHRALVRRLLPEDRAMLCRVTTGAGTVGCIYNLLDGEHVISYLQGLMMTSDGKLKPGFVCHALCMQACRERGFTEYDLLPEARGYKLELSNATRELVSARVAQPGLKVTLLKAGRWTRDAVRSRLGSS